MDTDAPSASEVKDALVLLEEACDEYDDFISDFEKRLETIVRLGTTTETSSYGTTK